MTSSLQIDPILTKITDSWYAYAQNNNDNDDELFK